MKKTIEPMTVERARTILGEKYDGLSDEMIEKMIKLFSLYSQLAISQHIAKKRAGIKGKNKK